MSRTSAVSAPSKEAFRWKIRKHKKQVVNICRHMLLCGAMATALMTTVVSGASANPEDGVVVGGSATITKTTNNLTVKQSSDRALIEWSSFNIDKGETTEFKQPNSSSITLNRVVNSNQVSSINGNLKANGKVLIINPNGVLIGADGNVDTNSFVATAADIDNNAFINGTGALDFNRAGKVDAVVENKGRITVAEEGFVGLVAPTVRNSGVIQGNLAKVQLGAADKFAVDFYGDGLIQFAVDTPKDGTKRTLTAENTGSIIADGGQVLMTAAAASNVVDSVINNEGHIQAQTLQNRNGKIVLTGAGAKVKVSGKINASGKGDSDGGQINIGGDYQGKGELAKAATVDITETAELYADAGDNGNGGNIIIWSDAKTTSRGRYYARGGTQSGNGGLVETSAKDLLDASGSYVNTLAENGKAGDWLLDPDNILISNSGVAYNSALPLTGTSTIDVATINAALSNIILAANSGITVGADVNIAAANVGLTLIAGVAGADINGLAAGQGTINFTNQFIRTNGGDVFFHSGNSITQNNATIYTDGGDITMISGDIGINNNAALGAYGGDVYLLAIAAGSGSAKTSGNISTNSSSIDTTDPAAAGIGGITLTENGSALPQGSYGNKQNVFVESANGGSITIEGKNIGGNSICFAAGGPGCSVADPVATDLVVTIDSFTKIYGVLDPLFTWGFTSGSLSGGDTLSVDLARTLQNTLAGEQVGNYSIFDTAHVVTGSGLYNITFVNGNLQIVPAAVVIKAVDQTKDYGDTFTFDETNPGDFTVTGLVTSVNGFATGDAVSTTDLASAGAVATAGVAGSPYTITASNATGTGLTSGNYAITYDTGLLTVSAADLIVTADNQVKTYGDTFTFVGNEFDTSGLVNGETLTSATLSSLGSVNTANVAGSTYDIDISNATGGTADLSNYNVTYNKGAMTVNPADLTVTANNQVKTYGDTFTFVGNEFGTSGLVNGETLTSATLSSLGSVNTATVAGSNYTVNISNATGGTADLNNYNVNYVTGLMTVDPAILNITAGNQIKTYGDTFTFVGNEFGTSGLVNGETLASASLSSLGAVNTANVAGSAYDIDISNATGGTADLSNYSVTYNKGAMIVNPANLTVTADNQVKTYGDTFTFLGTEFGTSGLVNGETLTSATLGSLGAVDTATVAGSAYDIDVSNATGGTADLNNYNVSYVKGSMTVDPASLTVTADNQVKTYGDTFTFNGTEFTTSGLFNGDTVTGAALASTGAAAGASVAGSPYAVTASSATGTGLSNYTISYVNGNFVVNPADLTITANNDSKIYDATAYASNNGVTYSGFVNGETSGVLGGALTYGGTSQSAVNVNGSPYVISASGQTSTNYNISYVDGQLQITPAALTVTADNQVKTYGDTFTFTGGEFSTVGLQGGETLGSATLGSLGAVNTANVAGSTYDINVSNATGGTADLNNYDVTYANGQMTVNPAALSVTADNQFKTYGDNFTFVGNEFTTTGLVNGETVTSAILDSLGSASTATVAGSPYTINVNNVSGGTADLNNYVVTYNTGVMTVNQAALLLITALNQTKTYGDTFTFNGTEFTPTGLVNGDTVTSATLTSLGAVNTANAGNYNIDVSAAVGTGLGNYNISYAPGTLTVDKALLTATADDKAMTYGGTFPTLTASYSGFVNGENSGVIDTLATLASGTAATADAGVYTDTLTASGAVDNNYSFNYVAGDLTIDTAKLLVTANDQTKTYGDTFAFAGTEFAAGGLVNGDTLTSATLTSLGAVNTASVAGSDYDINISNASGLINLNNYDLTYQKGKMTVNPATLSVTADNQTKTYGDTFTFNGDEFTAAGLVNGETLASASLSSLGSVNTATVAGSNYDIDIFGATGGTADLSNYNVTYNKGAMTVNPADLTVTADNQIKTYGDTFTFAGTEFGTSGLVNGETLTAATIGSLGSVNTASVAGSAYDIDVSNASGTADLSNYNVTYTKGAMTVNPATLSITANDLTKGYDATPFSGGNGVAYTGFVNGETAGTSDLTGSIAYGGTSQGAVNVVGSPYSIIASGQASNNYTISYVDGVLNITPAKLGVAADDKAKVYGDADPALTYTLLGGLQGSDTANDVLSGALVRDLGEDVNLYAIKQGTLSANSNYALGFVNGNFQITPAPLTITANDDSKIADGVPYLGGNGLTYSGFKFNDDPSVLFGTIDFGGNSQGATDIGSYDISPFGKIGARNYRITFVDGTLDINPAPLSFFTIDPLGRPIISVANQAIVLDQPFEEIETLEIETNVGIAATEPSASSLSGIEPAAGDATSAEDIANIEPAAGGQDTTSEGEGDESSRDIQCANDFLDNRACDTQDI